MKLKRSTLKKYYKSDLLEWTPEGEPVYMHSASCMNFCDFACNGSHGDEIAEQIRDMLIQEMEDGRN